jgi:ADP-ribose pyrophosphatase YjhB (NUDIX family)
MKKVAFIVGRFQVPYLTDSHIEEIGKIIRSYEETVFVIGLAFPDASVENPLDLDSRKNLIREYFGDKKVIYIKDQYSDDEWSKNLDKITYSCVKGRYEKSEMVLFGSAENFAERYFGKLATKEMEPIAILNKQAVKHKINTISHKSHEWRYGAFHVALNQFCNPMPCVDMLVVDKERGRVLLGRKEKQDKYRFFGGFSENFGSYEDDAIRELCEETGLTPNCFGEPEYLLSSIIDDWRYRGMKSKVKTVLFLVEYLEGKPEPSDDIFEVRWVSFEELMNDFLFKNKIVGGHREMLLEAIHKNKFSVK